MIFQAKDNRQYTIRQAQIEDARIILAYFKQMVHESYKYTLLENEEMDKRTVSDQMLFIKSQEKDGYIALVIDRERIENRERIVAFASLSYTNRIATKHVCSFGISVLKDYQNIGIATTLLSHIIDKARSDGKSRMELDMSKDNEIGYKLYQKFGFKIEGEKVNAIIKDGVMKNTIIMALFI